MQAAVDTADDLVAAANLVSGYAGGSKLHQTAPETFEAMLRFNQRPGFLLARAAVPRLVRLLGGEPDVTALAPLVRAG